MKVIKKDGTYEEYNEQKIIDAVSKSAKRALDTLSNKDYSDICDKVWELIQEENFEDDCVSVYDMHSIVVTALSELFPRTAESYRLYRNYKEDFVAMMDDSYVKEQESRYVGDRSNANTDSAQVSTRRSISYGIFSSALYDKFFLNKDELQAINDGYIYIHDKKDRRDTMNCCLADVKGILKDGFEMGNLWYNEPKTLDTAFDVISDVVLNMASQQYGGYTIPEVDTLLVPYAEKSYQKYYNEYLHIAENFECTDFVDEMAKEYAMSKVYRDMEQGFQGWEMKWNSVGSSRGDYPFIAVSFGLENNKFGQMATKCILNIRKNGQGKTGFKRPVLFPKLTFLYDEELHGEGKELESLFECAIECSSKCMYPDFLSLTGEGYIPSMYKQYGKVVSLMGCRASLSPWYERGGIHPADENDKPVFTGRFNLGAISLHLPMILAKARQENKDFYEELNYYLEMIRNLHKRTYAYIGEMKASTNPMGYIQGGFYGGHLSVNDKIKSLLPPMTMSFGITALNELQELYNHKSLVEDGEFALEVMKYINDYANRIKEEDNILYAIYGTPAESLCFSGDTEVQTYDGNKLIKDIKVGDLVYSYNERQNKIELKPVVFSELTKQKAVTVTVTFDNGQKVVCTPDHPFAKRKVLQGTDGTFIGGESVEYIKAKNLSVGDRIKSNYITVNSDGHYKCTTNQYIHDINAEYFYGEKPENYVVHHLDANKLNNAKENLVYMDDKEHRTLHLENNIRKYCYTSETQAGSNNSFYGKKHTDESKQKNRIAHMGSNNANSKEIVQLSLDGDIINTYDSRGMAEQKLGLANLSYACNGQYSSKKNCHEYKGFLWYFKQDLCLDNANHRVLSVEYNTDLIDVYDISVEDNHNFYVGGDNGILVHNCGLQVKQFRKKYGIIEGVSDREYVSNSFHCGVWEDITPIQKQDLEKRFWDLFNGGKIQYVKYPVSYNKEAIRTLIRRAMKMGFYEGVNLSLAYCEDCGYEQLDMDVCPQCGSTNITQVERMNGYLGYKKIHGESRYNDAKLAEFKERRSM